MTLSSLAGQARNRPSGLMAKPLPLGLESTKMLSACAIPNVDFAILAARDNPAAIGTHDYLFDNTITRLGRQHLTGSRVPAIDGSADGSRQRLAAIGEMKVAGCAIDAQLFYPGGAVIQMDRTERSCYRFAIRRESDAAAERPMIVLLRECLEFFAGGYIKEPEKNAGLSAKGGQRFPIGRKRQTPNAIALLSMNESA